MLYACALLPAQIGNDSQRTLASNTLNGTSSPKGVSMPHISMLDKSTGGGFVNSQLKHYSATSPTAYSFSNKASQFFGFKNHANGEKLDTKEWTVISAATKIIIVDNAQNQTLMSINGTFQANNTASADDGITSTIGFFVDDKLVDVKPLFLQFSEACASEQFNVYGTTKNLPPGKHTVKFAIRNVSAPKLSGLTVTYGANNATAKCSAGSGVGRAISSTIIVNQPKTF